MAALGDRMTQLLVQFFFLQSTVSNCAHYFENKIFMKRPKSKEWNNCPRILFPVLIASRIGPSISCLHYDEAHLFVIYIFCLSVYHNSQTTR